MEMTDLTTFNDRYLSKEIKTLMVETMESISEDIYDQMEMFGSCSDVESISRDGFWSSTDGGVSLQIPLELSRLEGSGTTPLYLSDYAELTITYISNLVDEEFGERTEENEEKWYEVYDEYLNDDSTWLIINIFYYSEENEGAGETAIYMSANVIDEYSRSIKNVTEKMGDAQKQITLKENTPKEAEKTLKILSDYIKPFLEL